MKKLFLLLAAPFLAALPLQADDTAGCESCGACCAADEQPGVLANYVKISNALAADNLAEAQAAAASFACCLKCEDQGELARSVETFAQTKDIAAARNAFKAISAAVIPLLADKGDHYVMTCPMAGADWVQTNETVANPYYGSEMLRCGSVKKAVKAGS
jgi:hypothetical protein